MYLFVFHVHSVHSPQHNLTFRWKCSTNAILFHTHCCILWLVPVLSLNTTISVYLLPSRFSILSMLREGKVTLTVTALF